MSGETFRIMKKLDMESVEAQAALQCAPVLTGIKMSNLLHVRADQKEEVFRLFENSPVCCRVLYEWENRVSVLLYRKTRLENHISGGKVRELLSTFGYETAELEDIIKRLSARYQRHMEGGRRFPHEIGLLLGYPPEDVIGFIENEGRNFAYSGYWKVYGNTAEAKKIFEGYDRAREAVIRMAGNGKGIRDIMAFYTVMKRRRLNA